MVLQLVAVPMFAPMETASAHPAPWSARTRMARILPVVAKLVSWSHLVSCVELTVPQRPSVAAQRNPATVHNANTTLHISRHMTAIAVGPTATLAIIPMTPPLPAAAHRLLVQAVQAVPNVATVTAIRRADQVSGHIARLTRARPGTRGGIESDKEP